MSKISLCASYGGIFFVCRFRKLQMNEIAVQNQDEAVIKLKCHKSMPQNGGLTVNISKSNFRGEGNSSLVVALSVRIHGESYKCGVILFSKYTPNLSTVFLFLHFAGQSSRHQTEKDRCHCEYS